MKRHFKDRKKGESKTGFTLVIVVQSGGRKTFPNGEMMDKTTQERKGGDYDEKDDSFVVVALGSAYSKAILFTRGEHKGS